MRRSMFVLLLAFLCITPVLADKKKTPEVVPPPSYTVPLSDGLRITVPPLQAPQYFPPEPAFPLTRELSYQNETAGLVTPRTVTKVYAVADLVVPIPPVGTLPPALIEKPKTTERELIEKITGKVVPKSWSKAGGNGEIDYFPLGMCLVVNNTPEMQEALEGFLESLRKIQDQQVVTELRIVTVSDEWFKKSGLAKELLEQVGQKTEVTPRVKFLKVTDLAQLLRSCQADPTTQVMTSPTLTCLTGQAGRVRVGETEIFLTGFTVNSVDGNVICSPKNVSHDLGLDVTLEPFVSADCKSTRLKVTGSLKELGVLPVPMTPVTTLLKPVPEKGKVEGPPLPFTQFIQQPKVLTRSFAETVNLPDTGTALIYGGKATIEQTVKQAVPALEGVPVISAWFNMQTKKTTTNHLLVLVTTKVVSPEVVAVSCEECSKCDPKLSKLLGAYNQACKAGKVEEARRLAIECLVIDPTCFGTK